MTRRSLSAAHVKPKTYQRRLRSMARSARRSLKKVSKVPTKSILPNKVHPGNYYSK